MHNLVAEGELAVFGVPPRKPKAIMALTHKILVIAWHLLSNGALYDDSGPAAVPTASDEQRRRRATRQLEALGLTVTITPKGDTGAPLASIRR